MIFDYQYRDGMSFLRVRTLYIRDTPVPECHGFFSIMQRREKEKAAQPGDMAPPFLRRLSAACRWRGRLLFPAVHNDAYPVERSGNPFFREGSVTVCGCFIFTVW